MTARELRVAVLGTRGIPDIMGGVETHCQALYPRLAAMGYSITLFARRGYVSTDKAYEFENVKIIPLWCPRIKSLEAITHTFLGVLYVLLNRRRYDLLHVHAIGPSLLIPLARLCGMRVVMTHHGPDYDRQKWGKLAKFILRLGEQLGCRYADCVIGVSHYIAKTIESRFNRKCVYIPNGVILPDFVPSGKFLHKWHLVQGRYILSVGRLVPEKGFHDLLTAFCNVATDWRLVIAGAADHEDDYSRSLKSFVEREPRVILTGFVKGRELAELYSNAGLFVLPSYHEGLPIALLEALSYNLPTLASDIPANRELAKDDALYPVGDVEALRIKLASIVQGNNSIYADGRDMVKNGYDWDQIAADTAIEYFRIVG